LTLSQTAPLSGALIVTTPQEISLTVAQRGLAMFRQVRVPVLGVIENMSYFVGADGRRYDLFGRGGGRKLAETSGVTYLGEIPIDPRVSECGDTGDPIVHKYPDTPAARAYQELAGRVREELQNAGTPPELPGLQL
jgi:ATP-binding protein involved in chromosome partitioning